MKVTSLSLWKWNGDNIEPTCLGRAEDVNEFGYFQRGSVKEMLTFISRTIVKRTQPGQRQSVEQDQYLVHVTNRSGLVAIAVMDKEYPSRSAFCVLGKMCDDYHEKFGDSWRTVTEAGSSPSRFHSRVSSARRTQGSLTWRYTRDFCTRALVSHWWWW